MKLRSVALDAVTIDSKQSWNHGNAGYKRHGNQAELKLEACQEPKDYESVNWLPRYSKLQSKIFQVFP